MLQRISQTGAKTSHQAQGLRNGRYAGVSVFRPSTIRRGIICYFMFEGKIVGALCIIAGLFNLQLAVATTMWLGEFRLIFTNFARSPPEVDWPLPHSSECHKIGRGILLA